MADLITRPEGAARPPARGPPGHARRLGHDDAPRRLPGGAIPHDPVAAAAAEHAARSGSRSTGASSRASRARRSSRSAATTASRSRRCATSPSCRASAPAGCAWCEVEGEDQPADLLLARRRAGHGRPDPDRRAAPAPPDQPRADLQRPQRVLPAAVPEQVPEPHRHPGLPQGERRGQLAREHPDLQAHDPVPQRARPRVPRPVRGALPARRGGRGDRDPRQPPLRGRPGHPLDARRGRRPADPVRAAAASPGAGPRSSAPARPAWPPRTTCCSPATT